MLFVFLALYAALALASLISGLKRRRRTAVVCGIVALFLAAASFLVWILFTLGASHWSVSLLQALLSPMPESLVQPESLEPATNGFGVSGFALAASELIVCILLWAIPILGLVSAGRVPRSERTA
jgi:hypothetical protein